ncbi:DNA polymerase IV [Eionea flava]
MQRKIIHCDADCFFAAIEMRDHASLRGIPLAVGGDPSRRGVIATCNYEARIFGVRSAIASAYAKKLCPHLHIVPHNMEKYRAAAQQLISIFKDYTHLVESLSLDEAFLDVSASGKCNGSATLIAKEIRQRVRSEVGITISAGVSSNKFLAKVASEWKKPDGLTVIEPSRIPFFMKNLPVSCISGVGKKTLAKLNNMGIYQCSDIVHYQIPALTQVLGKFGQRLYDLSQGIDDRSVNPNPDRKSLSVEKTLESNIQWINSLNEIGQLRERLLTRIERLPNDQQHFVKVFIKITFDDFSKTSIEIQSQQLSIELCQSLFKQGWQRYKKAIRLLGIGVRFSAGTTGYDQLKLFD